MKYSKIKNSTSRGCFGNLYYCFLQDHEESNIWDVALGIIFTFY